jgi:hypothetical protein
MPSDVSPDLQQQIDTAEQGDEAVERRKLGVATAVT